MAPRRIRFSTSRRPSTYDEQRGDYVLDFDPHLFVNKRAVDFVLQEFRGEAKRLPISPVNERIVYIGENQSFIVEIERVLSTLLPALDLAGDLDVRQSRLQVASNASLKLKNTAYFAVFDKSDEALLNDYEALLAVVNDDQQAASDLFSTIIDGFVQNDPKSIRQSIDDQWEATPVPERLMAVSPIPVNEEQRKILLALRDEDCHYVVIQGPPGTGKSHTITAIAFDCILHGKNLLILSDKQEAAGCCARQTGNSTLHSTPRGRLPEPDLAVGSHWRQLHTTHLPGLSGTHTPAVPRPPPKRWTTGSRDPCFP